MKPFKFHGTILVADEPSIQNWLFSRKLLEKIVEDNQEKIKERRLFGELYFDKYPPQSTEVNLGAVTHVVTKLYVDFNGNLKIEAEALDNELGRLIKIMVRRAEIGFRLRGYGTMKHRRGGIIEPTEDFVLTAIDVKGIASW